MKKVKKEKRLSKDAIALADLNILICNAEANIKSGHMLIQRAKRIIRRMQANNNGFKLL